MRSELKPPDAIVTYNWARVNYQACVTLGYPRECEIARATFEALKKANLNERGISERDRNIILKEINTFPLRIAHSESKNLFNLRDFRGAATAIEKLLDEFDNVSAYWEQIHISKAVCKKMLQLLGCITPIVFPRQESLISKRTDAGHTNERLPLQTRRCGLISDKSTSPSSSKD